MRIAMFYHSLVSDWNHGNAHFLRGITRELQRRGHTVNVYEPVDSWSRLNLMADQGRPAIQAFEQAYPDLSFTLYDPRRPDLEALLDATDLVIVHEWNDPKLVAAIGRWSARHDGARVLFHDTHHRSVSAPDQLARYDLSRYDGALVFGESVRERYLENNWAKRVWTWHEAADVSQYQRVDGEPIAGDLVWIGNWGDEERSEELHRFLIEPVRRLKLKAKVHGVRYPEHAVKALRDAGIAYGGYLPCHEVPRVFSRYRLTVHVPRRPYAHMLPGVPTIRVFEALACGIPLVCAPWQDTEHLFTPGKDYLVAKNTRQMTQHLSYLINQPLAAATQVAHGLKTILRRHTCANRVDELLAICEQLGLKRATELATPPLEEAAS